MSILIKGVEMPKCCKNCFGCNADLFSDNGIACVVYLCQFTRTATGEEGVLDICPLIEVPTPHGRLIDADAIPMEKQELTVCDHWAITVNDLDNMPTIIEAEGI